MRTHLIYLGILAIALIVSGILFRSWLGEHDARLLAIQQERISEKQEKAAEEKISQLSQHIALTDSQVKTQIAKVHEQVSHLKTPADVVREIPELTNAPLNPRVIPALPDAVAVEAVPLALALEQFKEDEFLLSACTSDLSDTHAIVDQKSQIIDNQKATIAVLKKKPSFWHRATSSLKLIGVGGVLTVVGLVAIGAL